MFERDHVCRMDATEKCIELLMRISTCTNNIKTLYTRGNKTTLNTKKSSVWLRRSYVNRCVCVRLYIWD